MSLDQYGGVLNATNPGRTNAWPTANQQPNRPGILARWRDRLFGPDPTGATSIWLTEMRTAASQLDDDTRTGRHYADNIATTLLPRPVAIAAVPYQLVDDPIFGELPIGPLEPAHIHDQLIGAGL